MGKAHAQNLGAWLPVSGDNIELNVVWLVIRQLPMSLLLELSSFASFLLYITFAVVSRDPIHIKENFSLKTNRDLGLSPQ